MPGGWVASPPPRFGHPGYSVEGMPLGGAAGYLYKMLLQLQHRGQNSAGITTYNPERTQVIDTYKEQGLVEADRKRVKITNYQQLTSMVDEHDANCLRHRL